MDFVLTYTRNGPENTTVQFALNMTFGGNIWLGAEFCYTMIVAGILSKSLYLPACTF